MKAAATRMIAAIIPTPIPHNSEVVACCSMLTSKSFSSSLGEGVDEGSLCIEDDMDRRVCWEDTGLISESSSVGRAVHSRAEERLSLESGVVNFVIMALRLANGLVLLLSTKQKDFRLWRSRACLRCMQEYGVESRCSTWS